MTLHKQVTRPQNPPPLADVDAYFRRMNEADPRICHVGMQGSSPWLTLVVGSGCSSESHPGISKELLDSLQAEVSRCYESQYCEMERISAVARGYLDDLVNGRLRVADDGAGAFEDSKKTEAVAHLCVCAALLTRLYYRAKSFGSGAPSPRDQHDVATLRRDQLPWWRLKTGCVDPCLSAASACKTWAASIAACLHPEAMQDEGGPAQIRGTIEKLLEGVAARLAPSEGPVSVSVLDVWALSDLVWMCLLSASGEGSHLLGSGWGDLRLSLSYYDDPDEGCVGLPAFRSIALATKVIRTRFESEEATQAGGIYPTAARLLMAQADYHGTENRHLKAPDEGDPGWPPAPMRRIAVWGPRPGGCVRNFAAICRVARRSGPAASVPAASGSSWALPWKPFGCSRRCPRCGAGRRIRVCSPWPWWWAG